ncbi:hypothetical protein M569_17438 [Genlisea aurea]|uniref:Uncharacterized protein n=1 Tax=Genlisea aurea TaxID=192259 RepID=S8BS50_9LAMI|nr:hypothetical protein M569_17438 [Genlisea aurea]
MAMKPKSIVQAIFLLCVCSLLVYQVNNSHTDTPFRVSQRLQQYHNVKLLGRKDPLRVETVRHDQTLDNKVKDMVEEDADDMRNVVGVQQLFKDDHDNKLKTSIPSPAPSPTHNAQGSSSSIKGYIEDMMKGWFKGFSDESGPHSAEAHTMKISEISAPSESYAPTNSFTDSTGDNGAPTAVFPPQVIGSHAESPTQVQPMHAFMLQGLE